MIQQQPWLSLPHKMHLCWSWPSAGPDGKTRSTPALAKCAKGLVYNRPQTVGRLQTICCYYCREALKLRGCPNSNNHVVSDSPKQLEPWRSGDLRRWLRILKHNIRDECQRIIGGSIICKDEWNTKIHEAEKKERATVLIFIWALQTAAICWETKGRNCRTTVLEKF